MQLSADLGVKTDSARTPSDDGMQRWRHIVRYCWGVMQNLSARCAFASRIHSLHSLEVLLAEDCIWTFDDICLQGKICLLEG